MSPTPPASVERLITALFLASYGVLLIVGAPFVLAHRSSYPGQIVAPFAIVVIVFVVFAVGWRPRIRLPGWIATVAGIGLLGVLMHRAHHTPDPYVSVLFFALFPCLLTLLWSRSTEKVQPLLGALPIVLAAIVLFAVDLPAPQRGVRQASWGDETTFASLLPDEPPFIGAGGRLRPDLDVRMRSKADPRGVRLVTDSRGFRNDAEIPAEPGPDELRILNIGDSFSIGMQIDQAEFLGARLEAILEAANDATPVTVINAEVSDPVYGLYFLQQYGLAYRPDFVLLGLCGNDMMQAADLLGDKRRFRLDEAGRLVANTDGRGTRGVHRHRKFAYPVVSERALAQARRSGLSRWLARAGEKLRSSAAKIGRRFLQFRLLHALENRAVGQRPALMYSYAEEYEQEDGRMRLIDGTANLGYFYVHDAPAVEKMYDRLFQVIIAMDRSVREAGGRLVLVLHPQRYQVHPADWAVVRDAWNLSEDDFDLTLYNRRIAGFCAEHDIVLCDLLDAFAARGRSEPLYLPDGDSHFNAAGHEVAAETVAAALAGR